MSVALVFPLAVLAFCVLLLAFTLAMSRRLDARFPPRGGFVEVDGVSQHYPERGPAEAPARATIVLLHGASGNEADLMLPLGDRLAARGYRVLSFDRPGLGWSDRPGLAEADTPAGQGRLLRGALERLGTGPVILVGHSLAGVLATHFALDHGEALAGLVLLAPVTHPWPGGGIDWYYRLAARPVVGRLFTHLLSLPFGLARLEASLAGVFAPQAVPADYAERTGVGLVLHPRRFRANARDVARLYEVVCEQAPRLSAIDVPTTIVTGDRDEIVLTQIHSYGSAGDIPGARLVVLPGVGHSPHWAAPDAVVDEIARVADLASTA